MAISRCFTLAARFDLLCDLNGFLRNAVIVAIHGNARTLPNQNFNGNTSNVWGSICHDRRRFQELFALYCRNAGSAAADAIGGSVAISIYGEARSTLDVDISVILPAEQVRPFAEAFQALGYYAYLEAIFDAVIAHQPFNIIDARHGFKADIFPVDPDQPTEQERQVFLRSQRRVYDQADGATAEPYTPEDVIIYKLKYYLLGRIPKHLRDIGVIPICARRPLDYAYMASWAAQIGGWVRFGMHS